MTNYTAILEQYPCNVPVNVAAELLGKSVPWVQWGLESKALPFGSCVKRDGGKAAFHISPIALRRYIEGDIMMPAMELIKVVAETAAKAAIKEATKRDRL